MAIAFLITGFSNWGKSRAIEEVFDERHFQNPPYTIPEIQAEFDVHLASNDDAPGATWIRDLTEKIGAGHTGRHLFGALCPSMEPGVGRRRSANVFTDLLRDEFFSRYESIVCILLERKWEGHAYLNSTAIRETLDQNELNRVEIIVVREPPGVERRNRIRNEVASRLSRSRL